MNEPIMNPAEPAIQETDELVRRLRDHENEGVTGSDRFHLRNEAADRIESLTRDAERYRWLRANVGNRGGTWEITRPHPDRLGRLWCVESTLDSAIDAEMLKHSGAAHG